MSFVSTIPIRRRNPISVRSVHPFIGVDVGFPLNINQEIFTSIHYGHDIVSVKLFVLQFLIAYYAYGKDRFKDALEYEVNPAPTTHTKHELYEQIIRNKSAYRLSYHFVFVVISCIVLSEEPISFPFLLLLLACDFYNEIKRTTAFAKPLFVSMMWTASSIFLPCVLYEHSYAILQSPEDYIPCMLTLFAVSSFADIKDVDEDRANGVKTLPVCYGTERTRAIILVSLYVSSLLFGLNDHYMDRPIVNALFELQNAGISALTIRDVIP